MNGVAVGRGLFVPWPFPAGAGLTLGIWGAASHGGAASLVVGVALLGVGAALAGAARLTGSRRSSQPRLRQVLPLLRPSFVSVVLIAAGTGSLGLERYAALSQRRTDRLTPFLDQPMRWEGVFDGSTFTAVSPTRVRLALVSHTEVHEGALVLSATARLAPGKRNPGGFDYAGHLQRRGMAGQLFVDEVVAAAPVVSVRERLRRGVAAGLPPDLAGLMAAMTLGVREDLGALRGPFTASGLAHLLSLSGLHFGVLLAAAALPLRRLGRARVYVLMALTVSFVALVGTAPSVLRAASMTLAALIGLATGVGRFEPWTVLMLALVIGLVTAPQMLFDVSFQLSYLALAGLLLFTGPLARRLALGQGTGHTARARAAGWLRTTVLGGLVVSVAAQLPSLSLVAGTFGTVPLAGPLVNVVAVPIAAVAVPLGLSAGLLGIVAEPLAAALNRMTLVAARPLTWLAEAGARAPSVWWGEVGWLGHVCWTAFVAAAALFVRGRLRPRRLVLVLLCAGGVSWAAGPSHPRPDVWFLDVGQGDAILVRLTGGYEVLIDGGGSPFSDDDVGRRVVLPALRALGVDALEVAVATHADADHIEGLISVLEEVRVGTLVTGPEVPDNPLDALLRRTADRRGVAVHVARRGETLVLGGPAQAATLEVLHPPADVRGASNNESSVVLLLRVAGQAVALFTGDAGEPTEARLFVPRVALLQAGHHGSRFSTTDHLLRATAPRLAVVSVGDNNYGHPHPDVLARLAAHGVPTYVTREVGAVRFALDEVGSVTTMVTETGGR